MSINLLPWRAAQKKQHMLLIYSIMLISTLFIIADLLFFHHWLVSQTEKKPVIPRDHSHTIAITLREINQHSKSIIAILAEITQQLPAQIQLNRISEENDVFNIEGSSSNTQTITALIHYLQKLDAIKSVMLNNLSKKSNIHFSLKILI